MIRRWYVRCYVHTKQFSTKNIMLILIATYGTVCFFKCYFNYPFYLMRKKTSAITIHIIKICASAVVSGFKFKDKIRIKVFPEFTILYWCINHFFILLLLSFFFNILVLD